MTDEVRVTLYRNSLSPKNGKTVLIDTALTLTCLLDRCSTELGFPARKLYTALGTLLQSPNSLKDGACLYVSQGEQFLVRSSTTKPRVKSKYELVLLGASGVGKTSIAKRYVKNSFESSYDSSIEDFYSKLTIIDKERVSISLHDTNGFQEFSSLKENWIRKKDAIILVHSGDVEGSLEYTYQDYMRICSLYNIESSTSPIIVIATNKVDRLPLSGIEQGRTLADRLRLKHFEVSAATDLGIDDMFAYILKKIKDRRLACDQGTMACSCQECLIQCRLTY